MAPCGRLFGEAAVGHSQLLTFGGSSYPAFGLLLTFQR